VGNLLLAEGEQTIEVGSMLWALLNSPVGVTVVGGVLVWVLGLLFTRQPTWESVFVKYRGQFFDAVRHAEKAIPDGQGEASGKVDAAMKFLLQMEPSLARYKEKDLKHALAEAHAEVEAKEAS
jgi:hypothetical protein